VALTADAPDRVMSVRTSPVELDAMLEAVCGPDHVDVVMEPTGLSWVPVSRQVAPNALLRRKDPGCGQRATIACPEGSASRYGREDRRATPVRRRCR